MKKVLLASIITLCFALAGRAQLTYDDHRKVPLKDFLILLESKNEIVFSYDDDRVINQHVTIVSGEYTLHQILINVFDQTNMNFEFVDSRHILLTPRKSNGGSLCGYVVDETTGEPIAFASVFNDSKTNGTTTNDEGYFSIQVNESDQSIFISFIGFKTLEIDLKKNAVQPCPNYNLQLENVSIAPVVLKEYLADGIKQSANANTVVIEPEHMDVLPGSVEKDVLSAISFLPGITSPVESLDRIHVRGGTPDQNLILWDGIPMYHTSHFFGTISAFNPNIIDHVDVYRSGIGSEFGGRVSSVIDIHSTEEITDDFHFGAGFNLTHLHLDFDIPLWKNSSLMISTRRSITDAWNTPTFIRYAEKVFQGTEVENSNFNDPDLQFSDEFKFNDANLKWMMDYGKNKFRFSSLGTLNSLNYKSDIEEWQVYSVDVMDLRNAGANFTWERQWNPRYSSKLEITNAEYKFDYDFSIKRKEDNTTAPYALISNNSITDGGLNWDNQWKVNEEQNISFGYQFTENKTRIDITARNRQDSTKTDLDFENRLHSLYGEYSLNLTNTLQLDVGLRYLYQEVLRNNYFEPRIALVTSLTDRLKLKISTGKHFQFVSQLVAFDTNRLGFNNQFWVTAQNADNDNNVTIPVIESNQWMGGFIYRKGSWTLDVEGYVKELAGITTFSSSFFELDNKPFSSGNSRIRGIDFLLKKRFKRYRSWVSYSLSKIKYEFPEISLDPIVASHDQTHIFKWVHLYKYKFWDFSLGLEYRSGLPATQAFLVDDQIAYGEPNALRLSQYFRMDASIVYNFGSAEKWNGFISFSLQNLTDNTNILGRNYILAEQDMTLPPALLEINEQGLRLTPNLSVNIRLN